MTAFGAGHVELGGRNIQSHDTILGLLAAYDIKQFHDYPIDSVSVGNKHYLDFRQTGGPLAACARLVQNVARVGPGALLRVREAQRAWQSQENGWLISSPTSIQLAQSTADTSLVHYFGARVADGVFRPWTIRTMASEPEEVYIGNLAPLIGRRSVPIKRVRGGLESFLRAVDQRLDISYGHRINRLLIEGNQVVGVAGTAEGRGDFSEKADIVVLATPAGIAGSIVEHELPELAKALRRVIYRPVATVIAEYSSAKFPGGVGGIFLPRGSAVSHISKQSSATRTVLRYSIGGIAARGLLTAQTSIEELLRVSEEGFLKFGGRLGERTHHTGRIWLPGVCAQSWMHHRTMADILASSKTRKGLTLVGDYFNSNSMDGCVYTAQHHTDQALSRHAAAGHETIRSSVLCDGLEVGNI